LVDTVSDPARKNAGYRNQNIDIVGEVRCHRGRQKFARSFGTLIFQIVHKTRRRAGVGKRRIDTDIADQTRTSWPETTSAR
jgi:hypothetical protein